MFKADAPSPAILLKEFCVRLHSVHKVNVEDVTAEGTLNQFHSPQSQLSSDVHKKARKTAGRVGSQRAGADDGDRGSGPQEKELLSLTFITFPIS